MQKKDIDALKKKFTAVVKARLHPEVFFIDVTETSVNGGRVVLELHNAVESFKIAADQQNTRQVNNLADHAVNAILERRVHMKKAVPEAAVKKVNRRTLKCIDV